MTPSSPSSVLGIKCAIPPLELLDCSWEVCHLSDSGPLQAASPALWDLTPERDAVSLGSLRRSSRNQEGGEDKAGGPATTMPLQAKPESYISIYIYIYTYNLRHWTSLDKNTICRHHVQGDPGPKHFPAIVFCASCVSDFSSLLLICTCVFF